MFNKSPLFRRWVETSDRNKTKEQDPKKRKGHFFFKFESLPAKELWHKTLKSVLDNLKVKPEKLKEDDIRTCFNVSLSTDMWESLANSPQVNYIVQTLLQLRNSISKNPMQERHELFMESISYLYEGEFPVEGSNVVGSFYKPANPDFTILILKVSEDWGESAHR